MAGDGDDGSAVWLGSRMVITPEQLDTMDDVVLGYLIANLWRRWQEEAERAGRSLSDRHLTLALEGYVR